MFSEEYGCSNGCEFCRMINRLIVGESTGHRVYTGTDGDLSYILHIGLCFMLSGGNGSFQQHCWHSHNDSGILQHRFQSLDLHGTVRRRQTPAGQLHEV